MLNLSAKKEQMDENNSSFSSQTKSLANIVNTVPTIILSQGYPKLYEIKMVKYGLVVKMLL